MESLFSSSDDLAQKLRMVARYVAQPHPVTDPVPCVVSSRGNLYVGNKYHAMDVAALQSLGIKGVLNCAPMGIRSLPIAQYRENNILYAFTNVAQDAESSQGGLGKFAPSQTARAAKYS